MSAPVAGLTPQSTYHFRVVATNASGTTAGADETFTTDVAAGAPDLRRTRSCRLRPSSPSRPSRRPVLGRSVTVDVVSGSVLVRLAGASAFVDLDGNGASLPVGSSIDAGHGVLRLSAALPGGRSQNGTFWAGLFRVGRTAGTGMTNLVVPPAEGLRSARRGRCLAVARPAAPASG